MNLGCIYNALKEYGIIGDVRSAVVGSVFGSVVGFMAATLADKPMKEISIFTNKSGYAQPFPALLSQMGREENDLKISFSPDRLKETYVCEYAKIGGFSYREIFFSYVDKYSMCFLPIERSQDVYIVKPNEKSGLIVERDGNWFCKCEPW